MRTKCILNTQMMIHILKDTKVFFKNDNLYLWGIPIDNYKYIIYCPKGTVKNEFEIDLE